MLALYSLTAAFVLPGVRRLQTGVQTVQTGVRRHSGAAPASVRMVDIPRITLPSAVGDVLKDLELKNPNDLSKAEYNSYSGAAIGGTLIVFLLPGALIFDIKGFFFDFIFAALTGGGLAAFLALRKDGAGEAANSFGGKLLEVADKAIEKIS